jgi:NodT family efflux transporter outer membrane factor (OMF) lipoprotein
MVHLLPVRVTISLGAILVAGCQSPPPTLNPDLTTGLPAQYQSLQTVEAEQRQDLRQLNAAELTDRLGRWWEAFNDPVLNELVALAIASNFDLQTALERIEIASATVTKTNAAALPLVNVQGIAKRENYGTANKFVPGTRIFDSYGLGGVVSWEADVFGRIASRTQAAQFDLEAVQADRRAIMVTIVADMVATYAQLRAMQDSLALKKRFVSVLESQVRLTDNLLVNGLVPVTAVAKIKSDLLQAKSAIAPMQAGIEVLISTCAILSGGYPRSLDALLQKPGPLLQATLPLPDTLPSQLLKQRPDIVSQEQRLLSSLSTVDAANADFMPRFIIPLGIGVNTTPIDLLFSPMSFVWNFGMGLAAPIYTGGELEASLRIAQATSKADQLQYEQLVRQALKEVEDAVLEYQGATTELKLLEDVRAQQMTVLAQERTLYTTGIKPLFQVNAAELSLIQSREAIVATRYTQAASLTFLYKAIGGGWSEPAVAPAESAKAQILGRH